MQNGQYEKSSFENTGDTQENGCDGRSVTKKFNDNNSGEFVLPHPRNRHKIISSPEYSLKFLSLTYHHSHFLVTTCISQLFSYTAWPYYTGTHLL